MFGAKVCRQRNRRQAQQHDGRQVFFRVVIELAVDRRVDHHGAVLQQQCVAIGRRFDHCFGTNVAGCTGAVVHRDTLPPNRLQAGTDLARQNVRATTAAVRHNDFDGPRGVAVGPGWRRRKKHADKRTEKSWKRSSLHFCLRFFNHSRGPTRSAHNSHARTTWPSVLAAASAASSSLRKLMGPKAAACICSLALTSA